MSMRTVIEINHDYWHDLHKNPDAMREILRLIDQSVPEAMEQTGLRGVRVLGRRHHSETLNLEVK